MTSFSVTRHKKSVALLVSLPQRKEFIQCRPNVMDCIDQLRQLGVYVCEEITSAQLSNANQFDAFIVIAHYEPSFDALELNTGFMPIAEFVNALPSDFQGVLDFSSCYSASAVEAIKRHCPQCHVQGALLQATLTFRLAIYPTVVRLFTSNTNMGYHEAYKEVMNLAGQLLEENRDSQRELNKTHNPVKLGAHESSVFAPSQVERLKPFMVQVFFHKDSEEDTVQLTAQRLDPDTGLMETQQLPVKLKLRDKITVNLQVEAGIEANKVNIDAQTKSVFWMGKAVSVKFAVTIGQDYSEVSLLCKIMMEVNREPVGECMFRTMVKETIEGVCQPVEVSLKPYDKEREKQSAKSKLRQTLLKQKEKLALANTEGMTDEQRRHLRANQQLCDRCLQLMDDESYKGGQNIKRVFISSTSDLTPYREIARRKVEAAHMFPEMYEDWVQSGLSPRDVCCQKVLESDILLVILGSRYGYVEPSWNMSMTEIEYQTALSAGKIILAFILSLNQDDSDSSDIQAKRQKQFISKIKQSRILKIVTDETTFADSASHDLLTHKE